MRAFVFKSSGNLAEPELGGYVDNGIKHYLDAHPLAKQVHLETVRGDTVIDTGPDRTQHDAVRPFAATIRDGHVGDRFRVLGAGGHKLFTVVVVEVTIGDLVMEVARSQIGTTYVFGAANGPEDPGTNAFDCSGYTEWAWASQGRFIPHGAELQRVASNVFNFPSERDSLNGDLVFMWFPNDRGIPSNHASHVGLKDGDGVTGMVLDTRSPNEPVAFRAAAGVIGYGRPR